MCFAPFTCQRSGSPTDKSGAGAKEDCSRRPEWCKRLLRKKTREIWSPLTSLLMPPRTGHVEWNIVLFLASTPEKKAVKVKIQFSKVCLCLWDPRSVVKTQWLCIFCGFIYYDNAENCRLLVCLPRASNITNKIIFQKTDVVCVQVFWRAVFRALPVTWCKKTKQNKKRPFGQCNGNCVSAGKQICVKIIVFVCCGLSQV